MTHSLGMQAVFFDVIGEYIPGSAAQTCRGGNHRWKNLSAKHFEDWISTEYVPSLQSRLFYLFDYLSSLDHVGHLRSDSCQPTYINNILGVARQAPLTTDFGCINNVRLLYLWLDQALLAIPREWSDERNMLVYLKWFMELKCK